jgi:hypothetical protein
MRQGRARGTYEADYPHTNPAASAVAHALSLCQRPGALTAHICADWFPVCQQDRAVVRA